MIYLNYVLTQSDCGVYGDYINSLSKALGCFFSAHPRLVLLPCGGQWFRVPFCGEEEL